MAAAMEVRNKYIVSMKNRDIFINKISKLAAITYNNLACYYRRTGKIRTALTYLIQALEL